MKFANNNKNCKNGWDGGKYVKTVTATKLITNGLTGWIEFDVTSDVQAFLDGLNNFGWIIKKTKENKSGDVFIASREAASNQPILELTYS